jgi:double-stranded uracil-DNA glycosylase
LGQIPDSIRKDLKILFVGYNPSLRSGESGHHFANPNNRFWTILYQAGLTPRKYQPKEDRTLLELGYGFTNIVPRPTRTAAEITKQEYQQGRIELKGKIKFYQPKFVCFVGKGVYEQYSERRNITWGLQECCVVPDVQEYVAPSSSGLVRMKLAEVVEIYGGLQKLIGQLPTYD